MKYTVSANVWCEHTNDYTGDHWVGGVFDTEEEAHELFLWWMPDMEELRAACREYQRGLPDYASKHYEVEVAVWDEDGDLCDEYNFYNETVEWEE